jgi:hypothetical protein
MHVFFGSRTQYLACQQYGEQRKSQNPETHLSLKTRSETTSHSLSKLANQFRSADFAGVVGGSTTLTE